VKNKWFHVSKHCYSIHSGRQMAIFKFPSSHGSYGVAYPVPHVKGAQIPSTRSLRWL